MSAYELDDDMVRAWLEGHPDEGNFSDALTQQLPLPVPTGIGAVVKTTVPVRGFAYYLRWAHDGATHSPWIEVGMHEDPFRTDQIGRIVKVLSPGVELS